MCVTNTLRRPRAITVDASKVYVPSTKNAQRSNESQAVARSPPQFSAASFFGSPESTCKTTDSIPTGASRYPTLTASTTSSSSMEPSYVSKYQRPKRKRKPQKPGKTAKMHERHFVVHNYHDHALDTREDHDENAESAACSKRRGGASVSFPLKLHAMLDQIEADGLGHVISWQPHGRAFVVHDPKKFVSHVMPKYFRQSKLTSFQRQLNLYGFCRLTKGDDNRGYYHELFLRGRTFLCKQMVRTKVKGTGFKAASSPEQEPNFYSMPPVIITPSTSGASDEESSMESDDHTVTHQFAPYQVLDCPQSPPSMNQCYDTDALSFAMAPISPLLRQRDFVVSEQEVLCQQQFAVPTFYPPSIITTEVDHIFDEAVDDLFIEHIDEDDGLAVDDFVKTWATSRNGRLEHQLSFDVDDVFDIDTDDEALKDDFQFGCLLESLLTE